MSESDPSTGLKFLVTNTLVARDIQRSVAFYRDVLGATVQREGEPTFLKLGNIWLTINVGGGPTDDKPEVLAAPPPDPNILSIFLNLRVTDIRRCYDLWSSRGAKFITEPKIHGRISDRAPRRVDANGNRALVTVRTAYGFNITVHPAYASKFQKFFALLKDRGYKVPAGITKCWAPRGTHGLAHCKCPLFRVKRTLMHYKCCF